jgi:hypothetical protein
VQFEEPQEIVSLDGASHSQPRAESEGHNEEEDNNPEPHGLTRREEIWPIHNQPGGEFHPENYPLQQRVSWAPYPQRNGNLDSNSNGEGSAGPSASLTLPDLGFQRTSETDKTFWESIQTIRGDLVEIANDGSESSFAPSRNSTQDPSGMGRSKRVEVNEATRVLDGASLSEFTSRPGYFTPSGNDGSSSSSEVNTPLVSHPNLGQARRRGERRTGVEVIVPRWQPDAEVTICPICRAQFSK